MIVVQAANQISTNMCMQYTRCNNGGVATITVQYSMVRLVDVQVQVCPHCVQCTTYVIAVHM
jgi:hypothetical protein